MMSVRILISMCLALAVAASNAADAPAVVRTERVEWVSKPSKYWILTTNDCFFILRFTVGTTGLVSDITVADRGFATEKQIQTAIDYVKGSKFKPATRNGQPVETTVKHSFESVSGMKPSVSPQFKEESQKVVGMITAGDFAGASTHAEWMLSEIVSSRAEYPGLQGTMAQAFAGAGHAHDAISALRSATSHTKTSPKLVLGAPIPKIDGSHFQFNNPQYIANLLDLRLRLTVEQGLLMEALWTYRDLAGLIRMKPDDPRVALAEQLTTALRSEAPLVGQAKLVTRSPGEESWWSHILWRRHFTLEGVRGKVKRMILLCDDQSRELTYGEGLEWSVPASWDDCAVYIYGDEGTELRVVEFADARK
jgi:hypothetical protein